MEQHRELIDELAGDIKDKLIGGSLFGEKIKINDLNMMIVATKFYYEQQHMNTKWDWQK